MYSFMIVYAITVNAAQTASISHIFILDFFEQRGTSDPSA